MGYQHDLLSWNGQGGLVALITVGNISLLDERLEVGLDTIGRKGIFISLWHMVVENCIKDPRAQAIAVEGVSMGGIGEGGLSLALDN
jgi:hypothetical protein